MTTSHANPATEANEPRRYPLFQYTDGGWSRRDEGVAITGDRLFWTVEGGEREASLTDIVKVNLFLAGPGGHDVIGMCLVTLRSGVTLSITSGGGWGGFDPEKAPDFRAFVEDLHATLAKRGGAQPRYQVGIPGSRPKLAKVALVVGGALFVLLPMILLLLYRDLNALWLTLAGAAFMYPLYTQLENNAPRTYSPDHVPDELMP
jgi:hypothetical protein